MGGHQRREHDHSAGLSGGSCGMYLWITAHFDGAEMQREARQAVFVAAGLVTLASLGVTYTTWRIIKAIR